MVARFARDEEEEEEEEEKKKRIFFFFFHCRFQSVIKLR